MSKCEPSAKRTKKPTKKKPKAASRQVKPATPEKPSRKHIPVLPEAPAPLKGKIEGGTVCQRRIAEILQSQPHGAMLREDLETQLASEGHKNSTIVRAIGKLRKNLRAWAKIN
jgi:hypothetical protein